MTENEQEDALLAKAFIAGLIHQYVEGNLLEKSA